ncbi:MAG TPA: hypothetical protein VGW75_16515 [Solirubrobacteraceae bacterium]|jgi:uncharacterized delta-60 repeat protein|nr:hypothetical protein [Solirubrobacteraceae bacterium]
MDLARRVAVAATVSLLLAVAPAQAAPGDLDPSFGGDGIVQAGPTSGDRLNGLALWGDRIVGAGTTTDVCSRASMARWLPDGRLDQTFGSGGYAVTAYDQCEDGYGYGSSAEAVVTAPDGTVFTSGQAHGYRGRGLLSANDASGAPIASFGTGGYVAEQFHDGQIVALVRLPDGRLVGGGSWYALGRADWEVHRWLPNGARDASFGDGGAVVLSTGSNYGWLSAMVADGDAGAMVAAGSFRRGTGDSKLAIGRFTAGGPLDPGFGEDGRAYVDAEGLDLGRVDLARTSDGSFVVSAGSALLRFDSSGELDPTFGAGGRVDGLPLAARDVALDGEDRIVVAGVSPDGRFAVARHLANGALDGTFGSGGMTVVDVPAAGVSPYEIAGPRDVVIQPDGRIVVGGTSNAGGENVMTVLRLLPDDRVVARDEAEGELVGNAEPGDAGDAGDGGTAGGEAAGGQAESLQPSRRRVSITILSSRVTRRGVLVRVTWPRGTDGEARARLWTRDKRVLLGRRTVTVLPGTIGRRFRIPLNRRAKRMLRGGRVLKVRATVVVTGLPARR